MKKEYKGYIIKIEQDDLTEGPREWDNLGTIACFHSRYNLGDEHNFSGPDELVEFVKQENIIALPLYLYDHSGITISTKPFSCRWDSGQVGYIYVTKDRVREEYNVKKVSKKLIKRVTDVLQSEVEVYDNFLTGEVYFYSIEDSDGDSVDSCGGFYGTDFENNGLLEYARNAIDDKIETQRKTNVKEEKARIEKLKSYIRNNVPLNKRVFA